MTAISHAPPLTRKRSLEDSTSPEEPLRYNVRKKPKLSTSVISPCGSTANLQLVPKAPPTKDYGGNVNSKWKIPTPGSLREYASHTQDDLRKIFEERRYREILLGSSSEESDSSEEEETSDKKREEKEGWKILMRAIESKRLRAQSCTPSSEG